MPEENKTTQTDSENESTLQPFALVALGASAGGLEALQDFFDRMPADSGMAFMVIQHLSPKGKSLLRDILQKHTLMKVMTTEDGMRIEPNCVYLNPAGKAADILDGEFQITDPVKTHGISFPIDHFFRSLAVDRGERAVCIILSGTGSDGTLGLRAIKEAGGMTIVQTPEDAKYDGMPRSAIESGVVDQILPVASIPGELLGYVKHPYVKTLLRDEGEDKEFAGYAQRILLLLRATTGRDFTLYKQSTIHRRIKRRMAIHKIENIKTYYRYLQENTSEGTRLFKELLILVTNFFRDPAALEMLSTKVIPDILAHKEDGAQLRVWVPGCATGEEALSIAMLITEAMEKLNKHPILQVFATDIDPDAIERARSAEYPESIASDVSPERLKRFFIKKNGTFKAKKEIRDSIVFAVQDLVTDPPFSRLDLVSCRNVLIYMDAPLQKKILPLFHYILNQDGYLLLGTSESVGTFVNLFSPVDIKAKIYKAKKVLSQQVVALLSPGGASLRHREKDGLTKVGVQELVEKTILDDYAPACVLLNDKYDVIYFQGPTDNYLRHPQGVPTYNILKMTPDPLRSRLPLALQKALKEKEITVLEKIRIKSGDKLRTVDVTIRPVRDTENTPALALIIFTDKPDSRRVVRKKGGPEGQAMDQNIIAIEQELQSTRENLQATIEELEASNEELKSTNEELQSTNEELQSMNEEMETAKEELQSTNEELVTVNSELQVKVDQLTEANNDINNLLASTEIGTIFLDAHLSIKRFTPSMTKFFQLRPSDIGRPLKDLSTNIAYRDLYQDTETVLETLQTKETEVRAGDEKWFSMRILPYRTRENVIDGIVITFVDVTERKNAEELMREAKVYAESIVETVHAPLLTLDSELKVVSANRQFYRRFKASREDTVHRHIFELGNGRWDIPDLRKLLDRLLTEGSAFDDFAVEHRFSPTESRRILLNARRIEREGNSPELILLSFEDSAPQAAEVAELRATVKKLETRIEDMKSLTISTAGTDKQG